MTMEISNLSEDSTRLSTNQKIQLFSCEMDKEVLDSILKFFEEKKTITLNGGAINRSLGTEQRKYIKTKFGKFQKFINDHIDFFSVENDMITLVKVKKQEKKEIKIEKVTQEIKKKDEESFDALSFIVDKKKEIGECLSSEEWCVLANAFPWMNAEEKKILRNNYGTILKFVQSVPEYFEVALNEKNTWIIKLVSKQKQSALIKHVEKKRIQEAKAKQEKEEKEFDPITFIETKKKEIEEQLSSEDWIELANAFRWMTVQEKSILRKNYGTILKFVQSVPEYFEVALNEKNAWVIKLPSKKIAYRMDKKYLELLRENMSTNWINLSNAFSWMNKDHYKEMNNPPMKLKNFVLSHPEIFDVSVNEEQTGEWIKIKLTDSFVNQPEKVKTKNTSQTKQETKQNENTTIVNVSSVFVEIDDPEDDFDVESFVNSNKKEIVEFLSSKTWSLFDGSFSWITPEDRKKIKKEYQSISKFVLSHPKYFQMAKNENDILFVRLTEEFEEQLQTKIENELLPETLELIQKYMQINWVKLEDALCWLPTNELKKMLKKKKLKQFIVSNPEIFETKSENSIFFVKLHRSIVDHSVRSIYRIPGLKTAEYIYSVDFELIATVGEKFIPIEIGIVKYDMTNHQIVDKFHSFFNPGKVDPYLMRAAKFTEKQIHGIPFRKMGLKLAKKPLKQVMKELLIFVEYNPKKQTLFVAKGKTAEIKAFQYISNQLDLDLNFEVYDICELVRHYCPDMCRRETEHVERQAARYLKHSEKCSFHQGLDEVYHCALDDAMANAILIEEGFEDSFDSFLELKKIRRKKISK